MCSFPVIRVLCSAENNDLHGRERFCRIACWKSTEGLLLSRKKMFPVNNLRGGASRHSRIRRVPLGIKTSAFHWLAEGWVSYGARSGNR